MTDSFLLDKGAHPSIRKLYEMADEIASGKYKGRKCTYELVTGEKHWQILVRRLPNHGEEPSETMTKPVEIPRASGY